MIRALLAALVAVAAIAVVFVGTAGGSRASREGKLVLGLEFVAFSLVDTGPPGDTPGDLLVTRNRLERGGRDVGRGFFHCITIRVGAINCSGTLVFRDGRVMVDFESVGTLVKNSGAGAITGGTGAYRRARGEVSHRNSPSTSTFTLRITR